MEEEEKIKEGISNEDVDTWYLKEASADGPTDKHVPSETNSEVEEPIQDSPTTLPLQDYEGKDDWKDIRKEDVHKYGL